MDCLYAPSLGTDTRIVDLSDDELRHARALRLRDHEQVMISNGVGLCAICHVEVPEHRNLQLVVDSLLPNHGELHRTTRLAIGTLDNKERMEWLVEKATELGVSEICFIRSRFASARDLGHQRLMAKALAALKQCRRSVLPSIGEYQSVELFLADHRADMIVLADPEGSSQIELGASVSILVGPEGGFDDAERAAIRAVEGAQVVGLAPARLRAETAAIAALAFCASR